MYIKAALVVGAVLSSPFIFYFLWNFVAVGLYPHEKKYVHMFLPISLGLFLSGVMLAFFVVFKFVLTFLFQFYDWMGARSRPADHRLAHVRVDPAAGLRRELPIAAGDAVPGTDRRVPGGRLHQSLADLDPGDLHHCDGAHAQRRLQHGC